MYIFSILSLAAFIIYLYIGIYTLCLDKKSSLNRLFFTWCISMAVWAFAFSFIYLINNPDTIWTGYFWMKLSAVGWCSFSAIILDLALLVTENKKARKAGMKIIIYFPAAAFFLVSLIFFRPSYKTPVFIERLFYTGDFLYNFSFLLISIYVVYRWGKKSDNIRIKKQSKIICISSMIPFILNFITQDILPMAGISIFPAIGQIYSVIMVSGMYYVIKKYRLFNISTNRLIEEILTNMADLFILLSPEGKITRISKSTQELLKYSEDEIIGMKIDSIISDRVFLDNIYSYHDRAVTIEYNNIDCLQKDGSIVTITGTCSFIIDKYLKDTLGIAIVGHDIILMKELEREIDEHKEAERLLKENQERFLYLAYHDSLTGLSNRKYFYEKLSVEIKRAKRNSSGFAVFFLDLDGFKNVNDSYGHEMGDYLLLEVADRIKGCIRQTDEAARIGGDEFTVLITDIHGMDDALIVRDKINNSLAIPVQRGNIVINIGASVGISMYPEDGEDMDTLINAADNRMYLIKNSRLQK